MTDYLFHKRTLKLIPDLLLKYIPFCLWSRIKGVNKNQWLITERPTDARDNGYVLYKWLCENHPEVEVVFAIQKCAPDYQNVKGLGKIVEYGSWSHWYYFMMSKISCSTQWDIGIPNALCYILMRNVLPPQGKRVFLQHGITKDYMPVGRKEKLHADIFVCGAYPEWEYLSRVMGYTDGEVKYLGFARYDRLVNTASKRQILYMPTWRASIKNTDDVEGTLYYKKIKSLLCSAVLNNYLLSTNTEFVYFVHPSIRHWKKYFVPFANHNIKVLNNEDYDLQKLICSANLLVTDFSSIYFDFAYQGKPVVYYHFDYDDYRSGHYAEGYFSYQRDGFGPVETDEDKLIATIINNANNGWQVSEEYKKRAERFFPMRDANNCQRHYEALCELETK